MRARQSALAFGSAATLLVTLAPSIAPAQPAPGQPYQTCEQRKNNGTLAGVVLGGIIGGLLGVNIGGAGHRTGGAVIGAGSGAIVGGALGTASANCSDAPPPPREAYYEDRYHGDRYYGDRYYDDRVPPPPPPGYYDEYAPPPAAAVPPSGPTDANNCTLAKSPIYMPDGSVEQRYVHVCRDADGRYRVVE